MRLWWLRFVPWTLIGATVWLNVAHETTSVGVVAHAAPPVLWVVTVELAAHAMRARGGLDSAGGPVRRGAGGRMDKVRTARWLLAPWSTLVIRRWMILLEERSYQRANERWWTRKQAKWELQDTYGMLLWRFRAPRRARGLYRWGHLSPDTLTEPSADPELTSALTAAVGTGDEPDDREPVPADHQPGGDVAPTGPGVAAVERGGREATRTGAGFADFEAVAAELRAEGKPVNRTVVTRRLRERGMSLANYRADEFLARLSWTDAAA